MWTMNSWIGSSATSALESKVQRLTVTFRKGEYARFLSHLDLTATLEYAVRRARLPVSLSEGFSPRPRLSVAASLALGYVGEAELLEITLREPVDPTVARERLAAALPVGIEVISVEETAPGRKTAASRLQSAVYRVDLPRPVPDLDVRVQMLLLRPRLDVEEQRDRQIRRRDVRPMILAIETLNAHMLRVQVRMDGEGSMRPEQLLILMDVPTEGIRITRERIVLAP
jgi:radical SAM-linked protein